MKLYEYDLRYIANARIEFESGEVVEQDEAKIIDIMALGGWRLVAVRNTETCAFTVLYFERERLTAFGEPV